MKRPLLRGFLVTAGGSAAVAAVSLVRNVLIARVMGPAAFGLWNFCGVVLRVTVESHVGVLSALAADGPIARGAGRIDDARGLERRAARTTLLFALAAAVVAAAALRLVGGAPLEIAAILLGVTVVLQQQFFSDSSVLRSRGDFLRVAIAQLAFATVHVAALVLLVPDRYLTGALAAWSAGLVVAVIVMRTRTAEPMPSARPDASGFALVPRGLPTYLVGLTFTLLLQADRAVVGALLGAEALGHYGILGLGGSSLLFLPDAFGGVLWPIAGERFGRAGEDPQALTRLAERSIRGLAMVSAAALALALAGTDVIVAWKLPNFAGALPAMRPYLAGIYLLALTVPLRWLLVTVRAGRAALVAQTAVLVLAILLEIGACAAGLGILGVAAAAAAAALVLLVALLALAASRSLVPAGTAVRLGAEAGAFLAGALALDAALATAPVAVRLGAPLALTAAAGLGLLRRA